MHEEEKHPFAGIFFWTFAVIFLFANLGTMSLWGSEDRWAEVSRFMLLSKDYFHPILNGVAYQDKPLLSYWLIVFVARFAGHLNELVVRLPGAFSALLGLWATVNLGTRAFDRRTGLTAGWLMLGAYGFLFWSRTASADIHTLTAIVLAVMWVYLRRKHRDFFSYLVFYVICFAGAHTKGLPAIVIPLVVIFPYMIREKRYLKHLNFMNLLAFIAGVAIYFLPFWPVAVTALPEGCRYASETAQNSNAGEVAGHLEALKLVWRENILRAFKPFDHRDPFYSYLYNLPRILLPWSLLFIGALFSCFRKFKSLKGNDRWMFEAVLLIFLCFTISGSRRWYYILPIIPFCAIMTARFLELSRERWKGQLVRLMEYAVYIVAGAAIVAGALLPAFRNIFMNFATPVELLLCLVVAGALVLNLMLIASDHRDAFAELCGLDRSYAPMLVCMTLLTGIFFSFIFPGLENYRTEKNFLMELKPLIKDVPPENIVFYGKDPAKAVYYLDLRKPAEKFVNNEKLEEFLNNAKGKIVLISYNRKKYLTPLMDVLPLNVGFRPAMAEKYSPWESRDNEKKLLMWKFRKDPETKEFKICK